MDINTQINSMIQELDQETQLENEIKQKSKDVATQLKIAGRMTVTIKGKVYTLSYRQSEKAGQLIAIDHTKLAIAGQKYKPAVLDLVFDINFTEFENLEKLVQTFYYYKHDMIQAEDLEEDNI